MSEYKMNESKLYEFSNLFEDCPECFEYINILQVGETCLDIGASILDHVQFCDEITYFISGTGTTIVGEQAHRCGPGDIHIASKGLVHRIVSDSDSSLRYIHLGFDFNRNELRRLVGFYNQCGSILLHDNGNIRFLLNLLLNEYSSDLEFSKELKGNLVESILIYVWRMANNYFSKTFVTKKKEAAEGNIVYRIIQYVDEHIEEDLNVNDIAKVFSYNSNYVSNLFKKKTGNSLKHYIMLTKIEYAKNLLQEKELSVGEIAERLGYSSQQSFSKIFSKYTGRSPGQYAVYEKDLIEGTKK